MVQLGCYVQRPLVPQHSVSYVSGSRFQMSGKNDLLNPRLEDIRAATQNPLMHTNGLNQTKFIFLPLFLEQNANY